MPILIFKDVLVQLSEYFMHIDGKKNSEIQSPMDDWGK